ncbi:MAG TPA: Maf family nucleotide pyrophosphatase [Bacteroidales bacterium]|nr:Maf family nucleotide pyrophosphatase [Bacteroidales bacterium]
MEQYPVFKNLNIILASASPRRHKLMQEAGLKFSVLIPQVEEVYPSSISVEEVTLYLAKLKANFFKINDFTDNTVIISADTIVSLDDEIISKPKSYEDAVYILKKISGKKHVVITGVCLKSKFKTLTFTVKTNVYFKDLTDSEIQYYVDNYRPYDKAGAYGAQEWIGHIGISKIEGSFLNVMGLPIKELYEYLIQFC